MTPTYEYQCVIYHSYQWEKMVLQGWFTDEVNQALMDNGTIINIARMMRERRTAWASV